MRQDVLDLLVGHALALQLRAHFIFRLAHHQRLRLCEEVRQQHPAYSCLFVCLSLWTYIHTYRKAVEAILKAQLCEQSLTAAPCKYAYIHTHENIYIKATERIMEASGCASKLESNTLQN